MGMMNRAFVELDYRGVFSFYDGDDLTTLAIAHAVRDGVQHERLVHLDGEVREIIRNGDKVACIFQPGDELLELESSIPSGPFARAFTRRFDSVDDHYQVTVNGADRVASRAAVRIAIVPRDEDRYGYRLWLDREHGLLLRSEMLDKNGHRLEIFQFSTIDFTGPITDEDFEPAPSQEALVSHLMLDDDGPIRTAGDRHWEASWVPDGFAMSAWDVRRTPSKLKSVNTLMYSDGLAAFSVFIEDMPDVGAGNLVSRNGATVAVTHVVRGPAEADHLVTVVGELPTQAARRVARSIRPVSR
jgi:sigma-E factor negative regulatory protein RseB